MTGDAEPERRASFDAERFVFLRIPAPLGPRGRGEQYERPLEAALAEHGLGEITGGGSQPGEDGPDGGSSIAWCGIDVDATDRDAAVALLRERLESLGAPVGTEIHYTSGGVRLRDALRRSGWSTGLPRDFLHPYFEC